MEPLPHHVTVYVVDTASDVAIKLIRKVLDVACPHGYDLQRGPYNRIDEDHRCVGNVLAEIQRIIEENP
jgi:hypothetical protein